MTAGNVGQKMTQNCQKMAQNDCKHLSFVKDFNDQKWSTHTFVTFLTGQSLLIMKKLGLFVAPCLIALYFRFHFLTIKNTF